MTIIEVRGTRHYLRTETRDYTYMSPSSFHQPIPDNPVIDTVEGPAAVAALAARAKQVTPRVAARLFTPTTFIVPADQPRVPVLASSGWAPKRAIFQVYGVPIDVDAYLTAYNDKVALGDTDLSCVVTQPDYVSWDGLLHGREWGMWRLKPTTDAELAATGCRLKFTDRGCYRITGLAESVGYTRQRPATGKAEPGWDPSWGWYAYGKAPPDDRLDQLETFELMGALMLMSASGLALGPMLARTEDLDRQAIEHCTGFGIGADLMRKAPPRWPAQANDGQTVDAPIVEGMRFQLDPAVDVDGLPMTPLGKLYMRSWQRYGFLAMDCSGAGSSFSTGAESGLGGHPFVAGERRNSRGDLFCFDGCPWDRLRLIGAGTPANPIPRTA